MTKPAVNCYQHVMLMSANAQTRKMSDYAVLQIIITPNEKTDYAIAIMAHKLFCKKYRQKNDIAADNNSAKLYFCMSFLKSLFYGRLRDQILD